MIEEQEPLADHEIARRAARGAATYVLRTGATQAIQAVSALAVARILDPKDYGLLALALTLVAAVRAIGDLGITFSLAVKRELADIDLRIGVGVALVVAVVGGAGISLVWPHLGIVKSVGGSAAWVGPAMATTLLITVPIFPSTIRLERELKFSRLGVVGIIQAFALFGTQVTLLLCGVGLWSLVLAQIVGWTVASVLTVRASGRLIMPSFRGPVLRMIREGLPYGASVWITTLLGTAVNVIVAFQLGARGIGLFAWCTILATPVSGAVFAVHSVSAPTLARMRRDDGTRYDESIAVVMGTLAVAAAIPSGCLIGLAAPIIRFVFGVRWLPATTAVQFCLLGMVPAAICSVLASDANARQLRRVTVRSAVAAAVATLLVIWPLAEVAGVGGASVATYVVGPVAAAIAFSRGIPAPVAEPAVRSLRLFLPLLVLSDFLGRLVNTPVELALVCVVTGVVAAIAAYLAEGELMKRVLRVLRPRPAAAVQGS